MYTLKYKISSCIFISKSQLLEIKIYLIYIEIYFKGVLTSEKQECLLIFVFLYSLFLGNHIFKSLRILYFGSHFLNQLKPYSVIPTHIILPLPFITFRNVLE